MAAQSRVMGCVIQYSSRDERGHETPAPDSAAGGRGVPRRAPARGTGNIVGALRTRGGCQKRTLPTRAEEKSSSRNLRARAPSSSVAITFASPHDSPQCSPRTLRSARSSDHPRALPLEMRIPGQLTLIGASFPCRSGNFIRLGNGSPFGPLHQPSSLGGPRSRNSLSANKRVSTPTCTTMPRRPENATRRIHCTSRRSRVR
jgi:hypothetical protein